MGTFVFFAAMHNNSLLLLALGLPFDRALPWHKLLVLGLLVTSVVHMTTFYVAGRGDALKYDYPTDKYQWGDVARAYGMEISGELLPGAGSVERCTRSMRLHLYWSPPQA